MENHICKCKESHKEYKDEIQKLWDEIKSLKLEIAKLKNEREDDDEFYKLMLDEFHYKARLD